VIEFPYAWAWNAHPDEPWMTQLDRKGEHCRVLARGTMNSALIQFEDGFRTVVSRNGLRRWLSTELERDLRQVLAELELISHVSAVNLDGAGGGDQGEDIGGKRPPGGVDRRDDQRDSLEHTHPQKSAEHFRRRVAHARTSQHIETILEDAGKALVAWRRQPAPSNQPELSSPQWKHWVAESTIASSEIARKYGVSRQYVDKVRAKYRAAA